jgi:hypothetical protein
MRRYLPAVFSLIACFFASAEAKDVSQIVYGNMALPVDIARAGGATVGGAWSMWRAMSASYNGPLFIIGKGTGSSAGAGSFLTVYPSGPGGIANVASIQSFCSTSSQFNANNCWIAAICDQMHNTCAVPSGAAPTNYSYVTFTTASPTVATWSYGSGSAPANNTPFYIDYNSRQGTDVNSITVTLSGSTFNGPTLSNGTAVSFYSSGTWPSPLNGQSTYYVVNTSGTTFQLATTQGGTAITLSGGSGTFTANWWAKTPNGVPPVNGAINGAIDYAGITAYYCTFNVGTGGNSANQFNIYAATMTGPGNLTPTCPGGSPTLLNVTTAATATVLTAHLLNNNDLPAIASQTNAGTAGSGQGPAISFTSLPTGEEVPVFSGGSNQMARNRSGLIPGTIVPNNNNRTVYALFDTHSIATCCGTFGIMEYIVRNVTAHGAMTALGIDDSTGTGAPCTGPNIGPCMEYDGESGIFAGTQSTVTFTTASPTVVTYASSNFIAGQPIFFTNSGGYLPVGVTPNKVYYVCNPSGATFNICLTPGGTTVNVTAAGSGTQYGQPFATGNLTGGFATGFVTCDKGTGFTFESGSEQSPFLTMLATVLPATWPCNFTTSLPGNAAQLTAGGVSVNEGGDGSATSNQFLEGFISYGNLSYPYRAAIQQANFNRLNQKSPPPGTYYSFTSGSLPSAMRSIFARSACSPAGETACSGGTCTSGGGSGGCTSDAEYTDASGASYHQYADSGCSGTACPVIANTAKGFGVFTKRSNWIANSDCNAGTCPATQTVPTSGNLAIGTYKLFCNGTGTIAWPGSGTAVFVASQASPLTCSQGNYVDFSVTTAGTIQFTFSGTVNWADLQDAGTIQSASATQVNGTATITIASPGIVTSASMSGLLTGGSLPANTPIQFTTTGALPTGLSTGTIYYAVNVGVQGPTTFEVAATPNGTPINTSGSQSGTHTAYRMDLINITNSNHAAGDTLYFTTTGTLFGGLSTNTVYYIVNPIPQPAHGILAVGSFHIAATPGGAAITMTDTGSGAQTAKQFFPGATPHIITNGASSVPVTRQNDRPALPSAIGAMFDGDVSAVVIEGKPVMLSTQNVVQNSAWWFGGDGVTLNGSNTWQPAVYVTQTQMYSGTNNPFDESIANVYPVLGSVNRVGASFGSGVGIEALNGAVYQTDNGSTNLFAQLNRTHTYYLGADNLKTGTCNCWITQASFYPYFLHRGSLLAKTTLGASLP